MAPNGERWQVGRRWLNKPPPKPWSRRKRRKKEERDDGIDWLDPTLPLDLADDLLAGTVIVLALVVVVALLAFVILPLLGLAFELALLIALFSSGLFGRVVLRHPWTIEAVDLDHPDRRVLYAVKGWRRSRRAIGSLANAIETNGPPAALVEATPIAAEADAR